jgi:hypothetical protein
MQYEVGPNMAVKQTQDMACFMKGETNQPSVYVREPNVDRIVLMRRPGLNI